tara:strand:- start:437 stop:850 length:414 start_codon:yes stop_codon:yes gene_type:complete
MDLVPPKKPFTADQFKLKTDLYIKGALGGFDKGEMVDLIQKNLNMLKESGVMEYDDAISFIKERTKELKEFIKENPGETLPPLPGFEERVELQYGGTKKVQMVRKLFDLAGGEEGVGKSFEEFMADVLFEGDYLNDD